MTRASRIASPGLAAVVASVLASMLVAGAAGAQEEAGSLTLWGGIAKGSPSWGVLGQVPGMSFGALGVRLSRPLRPGTRARASRVTYYTFDIIPFAVTSPPFTSLRGTNVSCGAGRLCVLPPFTDGSTFPRGSAIGFGINPAGVTTRWRADRRVSPFVGLAVGGLYFDRRVPTTKAARLNFTAAVEAGMRLGAPDAYGITVSYRLHHLSNAGTAGENPGLASHVFALGLQDPR
jgi:hypothetical protein